MGLRFLVALILALVATPALAERLQFNHTLYPPLKQVLDSGDNDMVLFDSSNRARLVDLIAVRGKSARNWTEALEIVAVPRPKDLVSARQWMDLLRQQADRRCANTIEVLAEDDHSITFERKSPHCPAERAETGIYRLVAGRRSWFQLAVLAKEPLDETARVQWLALLASAHLD